MGKVILTSHVLIADNDNNLYLENNPRVRAISMWGGKREPGEKPLATALRELAEEVGVLFEQGDLQEIDTDNGEVVQGNTFISVLYLLRTDNRKVINTILNNKNAFQTTLDELRGNTNPFVIEKSKFIARIEKALSM